MWVLVMLVCPSIAAPSCNLMAYNGSMFEDSTLCLMEGKVKQTELAARGLASAAYCFDITLIGNNPEEKPNL